MARARKVSLREEAYRLLKEVQARGGATSMSDAVLLLAERASVCEELGRRLEEVGERLERIENAVARLLRLLEDD